jgi:Archaea-specific editing domain of threonyl-tRNA synthetase
MKVLAFLARRFAWRAEVAAPGTAGDTPPPGEARECVAAFVHLEPADLAPEERASKLRTLRKHLEWLARKRELRAHVLHSFTHLAGASADAPSARAFLAELATALAERGAQVQQTPFGWSCAWELEVYGESLAKVWKEI